jgi:lon-related putative ATP-dependent protease
MQQERPSLFVQPDRLRARCDPNSFTFDTTASLPPPPRMVGQERAAEALEFGLGVPDNHYHLFVAGPPGSGRNVATEDAVRRLAATMPVPDDWCYVFNFAQPYVPQPLALPAGRARPFSKQVDDLIATTRQSLLDAFTSNLYRKLRSDALQSLERQNEAIIAALNSEAARHGFAVQSNDDTTSFVPLKPPATPDSPVEPYTPEEFAALPQSEKDRLSMENQVVQNIYANAILALRKLRVQARDIVEQLNEQVAREIIVPLFDALRGQYADLPAVTAYLDSMRDDIIEHAAIVLDDGSNDGDNDNNGGVDDSRDPAAAASSRPPSYLARYHVNVLVDRTDQKGAPFVNEHNPSYYNLLGRLEYGSRMGNPYTDFNFLKPGAVHQANGGFLIVHIKELASAGPKTWESLKRALRTELATIENLADPQQALLATTLKPEPIPLHIKVILLGEYGEWDALNDDADFSELFKVRVDFDDEMPRNPGTELFYAQFAGDVARAMKLPPLDRTAVARLVEEGSRLADDQTRLSTVLTDVRDYVIEAGYWAKRSNSPVMTATHMNQAVLTRRRRGGLISDRVVEAIRQGRQLIATSGGAIGQINALSVVSALGMPIGRVMRTTARVAPGLEGVMTIEREAQLSGPVHAKGVLILNGYLEGQFGQEEPLSLSASITFEQVYEPVDGDSASLAELIVLLSALAEVPIAQNLAITGSVNQWGEVQPIGGATHKIEGFFAACQATPSANVPQGVIIPEANVRDLMLSLEVLEAVRSGRFAVFAVRHVSEAIELLLRRPAGVRAADGTYPAGSVNALVAEKLRTYAERVRRYRALM